MLKIALVVLLSAGLILLKTNTPVNLNKSTQSAKAQTVQAKLPENKPQAIAEEKALIEPQPAVEPEPQPAIQTGCEQYRHLISQYFGDKTDVFLEIANKESGCNPMAVGDTEVIGGIYAPSCGLFQVRTLSSRPSCDELKDPATNIAWAHRIYLGQGFKAWSVCTAKVNCV